MKITLLYFKLILFLILLFCYSKTNEDDLKRVQRGNGRIILGTILGDIASIQLGLAEGGNYNTALEPYFGEMILKYGKAHVDFPTCPVVHLAFNLATARHVEVAYYLLRVGAEMNDYIIPSYNSTVFEVSYPPALLFALGLGQTPSTQHAAFLQRLHMTAPHKFNKSKTNEWIQNSGNPPLLQIALHFDNLDGMHVLVHQGLVDINERDSYGMTCLHYAVWKGYISPIIFLLQYGANPLIPDNFGRVPLHIAAMRAQEEAVKLLLLPQPSLSPDNAKSQVREMLQAQDSMGYTPLMMSRRLPQLKHLSQLLDIAEREFLQKKYVSDTTATQYIIESLPDEFCPERCNESRSDLTWSCDSLIFNSFDWNMSLAGVNKVSADVLEDLKFFQGYFTMQQPLIVIDNPTAGISAWAYWEKAEFVDRYGNISVEIDDFDYLWQGNYKVWSQLKQSGKMEITISQFLGSNRSAPFDFGFNEEVCEKLYDQQGIIISDYPTCEASPKGILLETNRRYSRIGIAKKIPSLYAGDFLRLPLFDRCGPRDEEPITMYVGADGSGEYLHSHNASWNLLLAGLKKWVLIPPGYYLRVREIHAVHGLYNKSNSQILPVSHQFWMERILPDLRNLGIVAEVTQQPGDLLYIPHDWLHASISFGDSVAVSQQFCTFMHSDHRVMPLGHALYGGNDSHRGIGKYKHHIKSNYRPGIELAKTGRTPVFDFPV